MKIILYHKTRIYITVLILLVLVVFLALAPGFLRTLFPTPYIDIVKHYARENGIKATMVYSVMKAESGFRPHVVSSKGATGLMQITERTGEWIASILNVSNYTTEDLKDPEINIRLGCWYLSYLLRRFEGNTELALAAYNAGEGTVTRWMQSDNITWKADEIIAVPYPETENYLVRVKRFYFVYKSLYPELDSW